VAEILSQLPGGSERRAEGGARPGRLEAADLPPSP